MSFMNVAAKFKEIIKKYQLYRQIFGCWLLFFKVKNNYGFLSATLNLNDTFLCCVSGYVAEVTNFLAFFLLHFSLFISTARQSQLKWWAQLQK